METEWETATIKERGGDQKEFSTMNAIYCNIVMMLQNILHSIVNWLLILNNVTAQKGYRKNGEAKRRKI